MQTSISHLNTPLAGADRAQVLSLLADAFSEDEAMIAMLGQRRWQRIARRYFDLQLDYSDSVMMVLRSGMPVGVLLSRSPDATPSIRSIWQFFRMILLLRGGFSESQEISRQISADIPHSPHWYINQIAVRRDQQKQSIGQQLLDAFLSSTGSDAVYVDCALELERFYGNTGFESVASYPIANLILMTLHGDSANGQPASPA